MATIDSLFEIKQRIETTIQNGTFRPDPQNNIFIDSDCVGCHSNCDNCKTYHTFLLSERAKKTKTKIDVHVQVLMRESEANYVEFLTRKYPEILTVRIGGYIYAVVGGKLAAIYHSKYKQRVYDFAEVGDGVWDYEQSPEDCGLYVMFEVSEEFNKIEDVGAITVEEARTYAEKDCVDSNCSMKAFTHRHLLIPANVLKPLRYYIEQNDLKENVRDELRYYRECSDCLHHNNCDGCKVTPILFTKCIRCKEELHSEKCQECLKSSYSKDAMRGDEIHAR